jgi:hypothetical protein
MRRLAVLVGPLALLGVACGGSHAAAKPADSCETVRAAAQGFIYDIQHPTLGKPIPVNTLAELVVQHPSCFDPATAAKAQETVDQLRAGR